VVSKAEPWFMLKYVKYQIFKQNNYIFKNKIVYLQKN